jgi:hypothetical protein
MPQGDVNNDRSGRKKKLLVILVWILDTFHLHSAYLNHSFAPTLATAADARTMLKQSLNLTSQLQLHEALTHSFALLYRKQIIAPYSSALCCAQAAKTIPHYVTSAFVNSSSLFLVALLVTSKHFVEYGSSIIVFTEAWNWSLSRARWSHSTSSHPILYLYLIITVVIFVIIIGIQKPGQIGQQKDWAANMARGGTYVFRPN